MVKSKWVSALAGILVVGVFLSSAARADDMCKDHDARLADVEKRLAQLEEIVKPTPLPAESYRTSTGAVFSRVERDGFGKAWKAPDGTIWSEYQGDFSNYNYDYVMDTPATRACRKINGSLPTKQHFEKLKAYFELKSNGFLTAQGLKDLYKIFPDMKDRWFWSSSVYLKHYAYGFSGSSGHVHHWVRYENNPVRCVAGQQE